MAVGADRVLRLELDGDADTARVVAVLPWGERVELDPSSTPNRFFKLVPVPASYQGQVSIVEFVLTDNAHNRTAFTVDLAK
jgi:hypothetical protein